MKKLLKTILSVSLSALIFTAVSVRAEDNTELIYDGGFELQTPNVRMNAYWGPYYGHSVAYSEVITRSDNPDGVYKGNQSVRFTNIQGETVRGIYYNSDTLLENAKPGDIYEFSGWFRTDSETPVKIYISNGNSLFGTERYETEEYIEISDKWQKITQRFVVTSKADSMFLRVNTTLTSSTTASGFDDAKAALEEANASFVYADDLSFKKVDSLSANETAKLLYKKYYISEDSTSDIAAQSYATSQNSDGTWNDVNYNESLTLRTQTALSHLQKMKAIAASMNKSDTYLNKNKDIAIAAIEKGTQAWYNKMGYPVRSDGTLINGTSWWYDTIGQQLGGIAPILIMTDGYISENAKNILLGYMYDYQDMKNYPGFLTGANLVWYCQNGIVRGIAAGDDELLLKNYEKMYSEWTIAEQSWHEGIQSDYSFHQHQQNFQPMYSTNFIANSIKNFDLLTESGYITDGDYSLASDLFTEGIAWIFRGRYVWPMLLGREITESAYVTNNQSDIVVAAQGLARLDTKNTAALNTLADYINNNSVNSAYKEGNKYFNCSDFIVHQRPDWGVAVRMISNRTIASESSRTQNFWGQYSNAGEYAMTKEGDIQNDAFLYYDRTRLPGTTLPSTLEKSVYDGTFVSQIDGFAGGVSDGTYGAATMQMSRWNIKANKSWFFFDDEYVCLGSGITSTRENVATTVDTRIANGDVKVNGAAVDADTTANVKNVFTNEIGYYFPDGENLEIRKGTESKSWGELNNSGDTVLKTADVFSLIIPHGNKVRNDKYAYIMLPCVSETDFNSYMADCPVEIAQNSDTVQAVAHEKGIYYASFIKPGNCEFSDGVKISADKNAMVLLRKNSDGTYSVSISTAYKKVKVVNVTITVGGKTTVLSFDMPQNTPYNEMLGSTVTKTI